ncbi:MAG: hypothetical protein HUJ65_01390, partial [Oscillospiraceae bacterium]|nr:hypothetical protein [Oscillospiraceae bacterium]
AARVMYENGNLLSGVDVKAAAKSALPELMMSMNPIAGGLVLAAILAAVLSTVSPIILASGTMVTRDIYQRVLHPEATDEQVLKMGRITTAISGVICCVGAIFLWKASTVLELVYAAYSLRGALFVVVLLGIYWRKASEKGAIWSMICTAVVAVAWVAYKLAVGRYPVVIGNFAVSETYAAVVVAFIATIIFSLVFKPTEIELAQRNKTKKELATAMKNA